MVIIFGTINVAMFDWPWSGIHFASGFLIGLVLAIILKRRQARPFWLIGVGVLGFWEIVERTLRYLDVHHHQAIAVFKASVAGFAFAPETVANTSGDLIIGALGLWIGRTTIQVMRLKHRH